MRKGIIAFVAVVALSFQGALAAGLEDSVKATLDDLAKATESDMKYDGLSVDGESFQIKGLTISEKNNGSGKLVIEEISGTGAKPAEGLIKVMVDSLTVSKITVTPPDNEKGTITVDSIVMEESNLINLIPRLVEVAGKAKGEDEAINKVSALITREGYAKKLSVTGVNLEADDATVKLASMIMDNLKMGSPDLFTMDDFKVSATGKMEFAIAKVNAVSEERIENGMATKYHGKVDGIAFKAGEEIKNETTMVLGSDSMTMAMEYGGKWDVKATSMELRPYSIDSPNQFRLDLELDLTGLPSVEEYLSIMESSASSDEHLMKILQKLALVGIKLRIEERGLIGRLLQMAGMMTGMGQKDAVIGMVEQQGKPQAAMVLGQETADDIFGKITAFLKDGGALTIEIKPKGAPFGAAQGQQLAMAPDKTTELLDIIVTHEK